MTSVSSVGIGSGVLTSDLIDKLVAAEREPTEVRLNAKQESITTELSVFGQIQSAVTDFRLASRPLSDPNLFQDLTLTSSNSAISGRADSRASTGTYSLEVSTLAASQSLSSGIFADSDTTELGEGVLSFTIGSQSTDVEIDASNNTLEGIAAAINEQSDLAATATVLNVGSGFRLVITSDDTGADSEISITVNDTGDGNSTDTSGLSALSYTTGAQNLTENQAATDATFKLNGVDISRSTNTIDDVITGLTFELSGTNVGAPSKIEVTRNTSQITEKVQEFVEAYNSLQGLISENTAFNADNPAASGLLLGDASTRSILNQIQRLIGTSIEGLESASVRSLADLGILTNKDTGQLEFNTTQFENALAADAFSVAGVFSEQGRTTGSQVEFVRAGLATVPGSYDINITQAATKGSFTAGAALTGSTIIDGDNDALSVSIDGTSSGLILLDAGTYTDEELVAEIQAKINADFALSEAGKSAVVSLDASNQLVITSDTFGRDSQVEITAIDNNSVSDLGLFLGAGEAGLDVAGTINGVVAGTNNQPATSAKFSATGSLSGSTVINADNDGLAVTVDGISSGAITLTAGTYTNEELATEIQAQINADANLSGANASVTVSVDGNNRLVITSDSTGSASSVSIDSVDTNTATELGFAAGDGVDGRDALVTGNGQFLTGATGDASEGIRVQISGSALGDRGSVSYIEGVGERMVDLINGFLGANGAITAKNERLNKQLEFIAAERVSLEQRVTSLNDRLVRQFTSADIIVARLKSTQDFISQQLDAIVSSNKSD